MTVLPSHFPDGSVPNARKPTAQPRSTSIAVVFTWPGVRPICGTPMSFRLNTEEVAESDRREFLHHALGLTMTPIELY
jgi:hypothetical protein